MSALGPGEIRARRRPFVVLSLAALRAVMGLCLAWPLASLISNSGVGLRPEGDRVLFEAGGYLLLEVVRLQGASVLAAARGLLPLFLVGLALTAGCNGALIVALNARERLRSTDWLGRTRARLPALIALGVGTTLGQLVLLVGAGFAASSIPESLANPLRSNALQVSLWALALAVAGALGGFSDVAKASLIRYETRLTEALSRSWAGLRQRPLLACFGWLPFTAASLAAALLSAQLSELVDVSRAGAWRIAAVFVGHQLVILTSVAARAGWFARALRLVASQA